MHYVITGSLGHTGKPITEGLINAGHTVTVVTSKAENTAAIEALGAKAAVGSVTNADFVRDAFAGADAVYLLIPSNWGVTNWRGFQNEIADNYIAAIKAHDIRFSVLLSSVGAHMGNGAGPVDGLHDAEQKLSQVAGLNNLFLRPSYFMYNLLSMIGMVKGAGIMGSNFGTDTVILTHTDDIADVALQALLNLDFTGNRVQYIASDERTGPEIARVLGEAVGKPETPWIVFEDEQSRQGMLQAGINEEIANNYTKLGEAMRTGEMQADFLANKPAHYGKIKLEDFAKNEFAPAFGA
ncbi:NAD(P)H-binding protein [Spirosoma montaniterrae]|uniref:NAD-dependent dehydratase n=1 Tax=Spirosoma montaniterrae TaxID=1178516 RepID=A0A1P9WRC7_9BACT|nr:NAD(P)H-binding protein [Spirosoma montaniterrae]AQG77913.1 NAD-dependent dehydratase [Spirosoma montaniterrae]